ncbi:MAG: CvpA family protein [Clostridiales bacterium]|jgi:uncharacterized membrane protein required for colicin V production|nr:CvpA family protein [Clostridiales bacterium]
MEASFQGKFDISREISTKVAEVTAMSWVDLAALTLVLWSAAKGYINGACLAFLHLSTTTVALVAAVVLQTPLAAYLDMEWQIEELVRVYIANQVDVAVTTYSQNTPLILLPRLAGDALFRMAPELAAVPVAGREMSAVLLTQVVIRIFCAAAFFLLIASVATLLIRLGQQNSRSELLPEWQKMFGMMIGAVHGVLLSAVICIALDAVSFMTIFRVFQQDLDSSYLYQLAGIILQFLPP